MDTQVTLDGKLAQLVESIYGLVPAELEIGLLRLLASADGEISSGQELWSERDVVLITYADQIRSEHASPLASLREFLVDNRLTDVLSCVHLLPFCPYTSDDGFSVIDYLAVDPDSGSWDDIAALGNETTLMFDLVLNHCSQMNDWFRRFLSGDPEYADYFVTADPNADLTAVTRPRSLPLLTEFESAEGATHVWTTFSADQVDLNYANPKVLLRMTEILVEYAQRGARIIRLDAIAYLWKQIGTPCIHLPQTHAVVKLMRAILDYVVPGTILLTETNVPHEENVSYFGDGDEAHMVYQFSLPPLLLEAMTCGDTTYLHRWMSRLAPPMPGTTFFNFTASHDGIGVRPLEGLVPQERLDQLVQNIQERDGLIGWRRQSDGSDSPYELNISYVDAVGDAKTLSNDQRAQRFLASQAIMLAMQGVPAVYFHSLVGSPNDTQAASSSGHNRRINRHKYDRAELDQRLNDSSSAQHKIFHEYRRLLQIRVSQRALHPGATQTVIDLPTDGLIGFTRSCHDNADEQSISVIANFSSVARRVQRSVLGHQVLCDLLSSEELPPGDTIPLEPFQVRWLTGPSKQ